MAVVCDRCLHSVTSHQPTDLPTGTVGRLFGRSALALVCLTCLARGRDALCLPFIPDRAHPFRTLKVRFWSAR